MENDTESEEQEAPQQRNILKKILSLVDFRRPGTTEDLEHEIQELLEEGEEHGLISSLEEKMISSIFDFRETRATEIMTPAAEVVSFDEADPITELIDIVIDIDTRIFPIGDYIFTLYAGDFYDFTRIKVR